MSDVAGPTPRATILDEPDGYQIIAPGTRSLPLVLFLALWLWGWSAGEVFAVNALLSDHTPLPAQLFLGLWLLFWTVGGLAAMAAVMFQVFGRERLVLAADEIRVRREVFGLGGWKRVPFDRVRGIRTLGATIPDVARTALKLVGAGGGGILILTDGRPLRFGFSLGPEECATLVNTLRQRHSFPAESSISRSDGTTPHAA